MSKCTRIEDFACWALIYDCRLIRREVVSYVFLRADALVDVFNGTLRTDWVRSIESFWNRLSRHCKPIWIVLRYVFRANFDNCAHTVYSHRTKCLFTWHSTPAWFTHFFDAEVVYHHLSRSASFVNFTHWIETRENWVSFLINFGWNFFDQNLLACMFFSFKFSVELIQIIKQFAWHNVTK